MAPSSETAAPAVIGEAGDEPVAAPEWPAFINRLQGAAEACGFGRRRIQLRVRPAAQIVRDARAAPVGDEGAIVEAQQSRRMIANLRAAGIAVARGLVEHAGIEVRLQ